jgi:hypothetical protein
LEFGRIVGIIGTERCQGIEMKAYIFLVLGVVWIAAAIALRWNSFVVTWPQGAVNPATVAIIFRLALPIILFGWIVPTVLGLWLLWAKK